MLNLDQVHIFIVVANHLHFSRAADELHLSQSAVSATIAKLEAQLGTSLFHRIGRRVELTDAGRFLQREGQRLIEQSKRLQRELEEFNDLQRGSLQLGASFTVGNYWLPHHLSRFRRRYPGIELHCQLANADTILENIKSGHFDLGFLCGCVPDGGATVVGEERLILVVGREHAWFGHSALPSESLLEAQWLLREPGSGARQMLEQNLNGIGIKPTQINIHQVLRSNEMVKVMVCAGTGLAALPVSMVEQEIKLGLLWPLDLEGQELHSEPIWMVRSPHRQHSLLLSRFEALIHESQGSI